MKKSKIIIIISIIIIIIGIAIAIFLGIIEDKKEQTKKEDAITNIQNNYQEFSTNATSFNEVKEKFDAKIKDIYYTTLKEKHEDIIASLTEYSEVWNNLTLIQEKLKENCEKYENESEVSQMCKVYKTSYKTAEELYQSDIQKYQEIINSYNEWTKENPEYEEINTNKRE